MNITFPEIPIFEQFFSTLKNNLDNIDRTDYEEIVVKPEERAVKYDNSEKTIPAKYLYIRKDNEIEFKNIIEKCQKALSKFNHCNSEQIVKNILYCYSFIPRNSNGVASINELFNWKEKADLTQYISFALPIFKRYYLSFGEFEIGDFDFEKFERYCKKFPTDYHKLFEDELRNKLSIKRSHIKIPVLDLANIIDKTKQNTANLNEAYHAYFEELSAFYYKDFEYQFKEQQNILTFINDEYIDLDNWKLLFSPNFISVFLDIGKHKNGWIIPRGKGGIHIQFGNTNKRYLELKEILKKEHNFKGFENCNLHYSIEHYVSFCAKAKRFKLDNLIDECFLHYVIALDLIFGEKGASTNSVATRTSICTYKLFNDDFHSHTKNVKEIYALRSKYVHAGKSIKNDELEILENICKEIFYVLMRLNKVSKNYLINDWVRELDILIATENANQNNNNNQFSKLGIKV